MKKMLLTYLSYRPFIFYICLTLGLTAFNTYTGAFLRQPLGVIMPILLTPFFEWIYHKYLLHWKVDKKHKILHQFMDRSHYAHHRSPTTPHLIFAQPSLVILTLISMAIPLRVGSPDWVSILVPINTVSYIYLFYEWTHLGHHTEGYKHLTAYGRLMTKRHQWHHFKNENYWWGITSSIADIVFGTLKDPKDVSKSETVKDINQYDESA